jgi:hypothetical protein
MKEAQYSLGEEEVIAEDYANVLSDISDEPHDYLQSSGSGITNVQDFSTYNGKQQRIMINNYKCDKTNSEEENYVASSSYTA